MTTGFEAAYYRHVEQIAHSTDEMERHLSRIADALETLVAKLDPPVTDRTVDLDALG